MYTGLSLVSYWAYEVNTKHNSTTQWQHYLLNCLLDRNNNRWNQNINASCATARSQMVRRGRNNNRWNWETCLVASKDRRSKLTALYFQGRNTYDVFLIVVIKFKLSGHFSNFTERFRVCYILLIIMEPNKICFSLVWNYRTCKNNPICFHSSFYFLDLSMLDCKSCKYRCCAVHRCCAYPDVG